MSLVQALYAGPVDVRPVHYQPASISQRRTSYETPSYSTGSRDLFQGGLPTPPATKDMTIIPVPTGGPTYSQQYIHIGNQQPSKPYLPEPRTTSYFPPAQASATSYGHDANETSDTNNGYSDMGSRRNDDRIAFHLQIPESVNNSKGSLAEFAAEITCLFWFETSETIEYAESLSKTALPDRGLVPDATPSIGFRKWVTTIISTTQVGKNVVLLALMFIYRLKKFNPGVSGKRGSEFRLLTIALMLGNKFLDDNTYTNKTWAEVSGISVKEIHIMEVEFLSNMRYELYASEAQWQEWKTRLGRFSSFYEKASRFHPMNTSSPTTPVTQAIPHKLPSPPSGNRYMHGTTSNLPNPLHHLPHLPRSPAKYISGTEYPLERKRSLDTSNDLPPAKRMHSSFSTTASLSPAILTPISAVTPNSAGLYDSNRMPQLPIPTLPMPTGRAGMHLTPLSLPGPRAMSTVYPATTGYSQPITPVTTGPPSISQTQMYGPLTTPVGPGSSSRVPSHAGSAHTSPTNMYGASTPNRPGLSPSYFLMNRSSPYRPVRHVNTLLYPPPPTATQNPMRYIEFEQMHYQPLSKHSQQLHSGPMPFLHQDPWQSHASTPISQPYRPY